MQCMQ